MKIPSKLKIGGHWYKIIYPYVFTERYDHAADIDHQTKEIRNTESIDGAKRAKSAILVSFIHEILHGVDHSTGHHIFKDKEGAVEAFSEAIYQVLVDNHFLKED